MKYVSSLIHKKYFSTFLLTLLLLSLLILTFFSSKVVYPNSPKQKSLIKQTVSNVSDELSKEEYIKLSKTISKIVSEKNPKAALSYLQSLINIDPKIIRYCHGLTHDIGHTAYTKYGFQDALSQGDDVCGSGFTHGIIEAYFKDTNDLTNKLHSVCKTGILSQESGNCYHGVGHGLMYYTSNNIPLSLYYCDSYTDVSERRLCSEGVFMENFNADERFHASQYIHKDNPFYPCPVQKSFYKDACYFYATDYYLHLHPSKYKNALTWCDGAETEFINTCAKGVGSRTMKYNSGTPSYVEEVCMSADTKEKIASCVDGMVSYFLVQYNSLSRAKVLCSSLKKENQPACYQGAENRRSLFEN